MVPQERVRGSKNYTGQGVPQDRGADEDEEQGKTEPSPEGEEKQVKTRARKRAKQRKQMHIATNTGKKTEIFSTAKWVGPTPSGPETLWVTLKVFIRILAKMPPIW